MAGDPETNCRRRKLEIDKNDNDTFFNFFNKFERFTEFIMAFKDLLQGPEQCLLPTVIKDCDAASCKSFKECKCIGTPDTDIHFHFGAFFVHGVRIYNDLVDKRIPGDRVLRMVAEKLLEYILYTDCHEELKKIEDKEYVKGETQVMVTLAEHYFNRLSLSQGYVMDKFASKSDICLCGTCKKESLRFEDTSIGNQKVWHGSLDILFDSCEVPITIATEDEEKKNNPSSMEEIQTECIDDTRSRSHVLAQTIVYSMLQKKRHPESEHFLVPSIITNANTLKIFFYDGENDILMESKRFNYLWPSSTSKMQSGLVFETVIASWLVLNYKILCTGPYRECLESAPKSRFREFAGHKRQIYEDELQFRNVKKHPQVKTFSNWERFRYLKSFEWPSSLPIEPM